MTEAETRASAVELRVPADSAYVAILRTVTAGLAARCDLTLDDIEDLRIAVDEACSLLLPHADEGSALSASFALAPGRLAIRAAVDADGAAQADRSGFAWTVLGALASEVDVTSSDGELVIDLVKARQAGPA